MSNVRYKLIEPESGSLQIRRTRIMVLGVEYSICRSLIRDIVGMRQIENWPDPNITADPVYATESKNIFLELQNQLLQDQSFHPLCTFLLKPPRRHLPRTT